MTSQAQKIQLSIRRFRAGQLYRKVRRAIYGKRSRSWHPHFARLFERDIAPKLAKISQREDERVLFWTPLAHWPHVLLEYFLATTLRLRGSTVRFAVCDGGLPHCAMEFGNPPTRISCEACWGASQNFIQPFALPYWKLSDFVAQDEVTAVVAKSSAMDADELFAWKVDGYEVGAFTMQYLSKYFWGIVPALDEEKLAAARRIAVGNVLAFLYARRVLEKYGPEVVVMISANESQSQPAFVACQQAGIRVVSWDGYFPYHDSFAFAQNRPVSFGDIDEALWEESKNRPLTPDQEQSVEAFLEQWALGSLGNSRYSRPSRSPVDDLGKRLMVDRGRPLYVAFSNLVWDNSSLGRHAGFGSMVDWIIATCDWFSTRPHMQLAIRVHPGERRLPKELHSNKGLAEAVRDHYAGSIPSNILLIEATDDVSSYLLAQMADAIGVYSSSLGYELAARGRKIWVGGVPHYRGHGFTLDVGDRDHLAQLLEKTPWESNLSAEERQLALQYAYIRFFRQSFRVPYLARTATKYIDQPYFRDLQFLFPGKDPIMTALADRVIDGRPMFDIPSETTAKWKSL